MAAKTLQVIFVSSKDRVANILTKPPSVVRFNLLRISLTIVSVPIDSRGAIKEQVSPADLAVDSTSHG